MLRTSHTTLVIVAIAGLTGTACKKKDSNPAPAAGEPAPKVAAGQPTVAVPARAESGSTSAFGNWDMATRAAALDGVWANKEAGIVWKLASDQVTKIDNDGENELKVIMRTPCAIKVQSTKDAAWTELITYALVDGKAQVFATTGVGERKGQGAILCYGASVYRLDANKKCQRYDLNADAPNWLPAKCGFIASPHDANVTVFEYGESATADAENNSDLTGDAIGLPSDEKERFVRVTDLAAGRAAIGK
jgi:hypothetical protein